MGVFCEGEKKEVFVREKKEVFCWGTDGIFVEEKNREMGRFVKEKWFRYIFSRLKNSACEIHYQKCFFREKSLQISEKHSVLDNFFLIF
jgi:hypothetical protein